MARVRLIFVLLVSSLVLLLTLENTRVALPYFFRGTVPGSTSRSLAPGGNRPGFPNHPTIDYPTGHGPANQNRRTPVPLQSPGFL